MRISQNIALITLCVLLTPISQARSPKMRTFFASMNETMRCFDEMCKEMCEDLCVPCSEDERNPQCQCPNSQCPCCANQCTTPCSTPCPTPGRRNMPCPQICEMESCVCIKMSMPESVDCSKIEVNRVREDDRQCLKVCVPTPTCMIEMTVDERCMVVSRREESCTKDEQKASSCYSSSRVMQQLPCKVCFNNPQEVKVEFNKDECCMCIMIPKVTPEVERVPVCVRSK